MIDEEREEKILEIETNLRGYTLRLFSYVDTVLMRFIIFWMAKNPGIAPLKLKELKFYQKMKIGRQLIDKHYSSLSDEATPLFDKISEHSWIRNQMAHCLFKWPYEDFANFDVWDYKVDKEDQLEIHSIVPTKTSVLETFNKLKEINLTIIDFIKFSMKVDDLVRPEFPELVPEFPEEE